MAVTVTAALVDNASGWNNTPPAGHAGWNNTAGDKTWVPDANYNRRVLLTCVGSAGEVQHTVNWEVYDTTAVPFAANASTVTVQASGGTYTGATAPVFLNDRTTKRVWVRNATAQGAGAPYYADTGSPWMSILRANGPRVVVELPVYFKWAGANAQTRNFEVAAFLPGSFGTSAGVATITIANPNGALLS